MHKVTSLNCMTIQKNAMYGRRTWSRDAVGSSREQVMSLQTGNFRECLNLHRRIREKYGNPMPTANFKMSQFLCTTKLSTCSGGTDSRHSKPKFTVIASVFQLLTACSRLALRTFLVIKWHLTLLWQLLHNNSINKWIQTSMSTWSKP